MTTLLTITDTRTILQISDRTLRRLVYRRQIGCIRVGNQVRFTEADVQRYIEEQRRPAVRLWDGKPARARLGVA